MIESYSVLLQFFVAYIFGIGFRLHKLFFPITLGLYLIFIAISYIFFDASMTNSALIEGLSFWRLIISMVGLYAGIKSVDLIRKKRLLNLYKELKEK